MFYLFWWVPEKLFTDGYTMLHDQRINLKVLLKMKVFNNMQNQQFCHWPINSQFNFSQ